jgi:hypothetical protein
VYEWSSELPLGQTGLGYDDDTEKRKGGLAACEARVLEWLIHIHNAKEGHSVAT